MRSCSSAYAVSLAQTNFYKNSHFLCPHLASHTSLPQHTQMRVFLPTAGHSSVTERLSDVCSWAWTTSSLISKRPKTTHKQVFKNLNLVSLFAYVLETQDSQGRKEIKKVKETSYSQWAEEQQQKPHQNVWDTASIVLREKLVALNAYIRKERAQTSNVNIHLKKKDLEKIRTKPRQRRGK